MKKILILLLISIFSYAMEKGPSLVSTVKVTKDVINPLEEFIGTLSFSRSALIASQSDGAVIKVNFEVGDRVKKGDILVEIDSKLLDTHILSTKARVNIAMLDLEKSKKDYNRYKKLIEQNSVAQKVFDDCYFKYNTAKQTLKSENAKLNELMISKNKKNIKAAFDGVITEKNVEVSQWVNSGKTVATLVDISSVNMLFNLPTSYMYKLDKNQNYRINLKDKTISSKLYAAIPKGDKKTRTFPVKFKAKSNNDFLYDGMEVRISLPRNKAQESFVVPRDAVIKRFGQNVVFLNKNDKALMLPVEIIGYNTSSIGIKANGLFEGADVVIEGNERIFPDEPIKSINKRVIIQ